MALLAQKCGENISLSKSVSGYFKTKNKFLMATKPRGGGKGLSGRTTKKNNFFFAASLMTKYKKKVFVCCLMSTP